MNTDRILSITCPNCGNIYETKPEGNSVTCSRCGTRFHIHNDFVHDPYGDGYSYQKGMYAAQDERNKQLSNVPKASTVSASTPRKKSVAGKVIAIIACVFFLTNILPLIISGIYEYSANNRTGKSTKNGSGITEQDTGNGYSSSGSYINGPVNGDDVGCVLPPVTETSEQPKWVYLTELDSYTGDDFRRISVGDSDIFGNTYHCGFRGYCREDSASWRLNGAYSMFSFTFGVHSHNKGYYGSGSISIYKDGELIWECLDITSIHESETVNLDITGAKDLTVTIRSSGDVFPMEPAIFDPTLYR